jgi:hypothetical protein
MHTAVPTYVIPAEAKQAAIEQTCLIGHIEAQLAGKAAIGHQSTLHDRDLAPFPAQGYAARSSVDELRELCGQFHGPRRGAIGHRLVEHRMKPGGGAIGASGDDDRHSLHITEYWGAGQPAVLLYAHG